MHQCVCSVCVQFPLDRYTHLKGQVHITELKGEVHVNDYSPQFWLFSPLACKSREFTRKSAGRFTSRSERGVRGEQERASSVKKGNPPSWFALCRPSSVIRQNH